MFFDSATSVKRIATHHSFQSVSGSLSRFDRHAFHQFTLNGASNGFASVNRLRADLSPSMIDRLRGAVNHVIAQRFPMVMPNVAPQSLQVFDLKTSYQSNETLKINTGYVIDTNGWSDVRSVDFWLTNAKNQRIELADVTSFRSDDGKCAKFSYSTNLGNLSAGNYTLRAVAYDKAGAMSHNSISHSFSIARSLDWFDLNLKDANVVNLARNAAVDRDLSRNELLGIFRDIQDDGMIDSAEWEDLRTLVRNATGALFSMKDHVHYLAGKVVEETVANMEASRFEMGVMGKWFLGTIAPKAEFIRQNNGTGSPFDFQYQRFAGSLFGNSRQPRISGIEQGKFGDCVLLAAIGATFGMQTEESGHSSSVVNQMLIDNGDNTYTVRFFNENQGLQAEWVTVDNRFVTFNGELFGAKITDGLFMPIIEKAYAQWLEWVVNDGRSGWSIMGNGDSIEVGLQRIIGRKSQAYGTPIYESSNRYSFELIQNSLLTGQSITVAGAIHSTYLVGGHAYAVTHAYTNSSGQRRVVVYNPYGVDDGQQIQGNNDGFIDLSFDEFRSFQWAAIA
jgi:hypothetical protein